MSPKASGGGRRGLIAMLLVGFLLVATGVIWRRSYGFDRAQRMKELERRRAALVAERIRAEAAIRNASSRRVLLPLAESRLGMHVPNDSQVIILPHPASPRPAPPHDSQ